MASSFLDRLRAGEVLVSDGATGTNLQQRGLARGVPSERWVLDNPEQIVRLHCDFIEAGSDIILTSSFGGTSIRLEASGLGARAAEVNRKAAILARRAAASAPPRGAAASPLRRPPSSEHPQGWGGSASPEQRAPAGVGGAAAASGTLVAGSIGPTGHLLKPLGPLEEEQAVAAFAAQTEALSAAGVDLLVIETQFDLGEAKAAVRGARSVSNLPLVVSFSYDRGTRTMMGVRPATMAMEMAEMGVDVLGINCGRSLEDNFKALVELRSNTRLPIWFKPNAGLPVLDEEANPTYTITPEKMGTQAPDWLSAGAQIVGGCCGTSPAHLAAIARAVKKV